MPEHRSCFLVSGLLLAVTLPAQNESGGFFHGVPAALSLESAAGVAGDSMLMKGHGFLQVAPPAWPAGNGPIVDLARILANCGGTCCGGGLCPGTGLDVDALSMGLDWILADDSTGRIAFPPGVPRWAAITFSVTRGSQGAPGSRIRAESSTNGAGADVFSWVLPGSAIPAPLVTRTERAHDSTEIDLSGVPNAELDALDHFLPLFGLEPGMRALMPQLPTIFFSVSDATKTRVPCAWWGNTPPSGATILKVSLLPTGAWGCPTPFKTFRDLALQQGEDLDALAVDLANQRILFSTKTAGRDEILFLYCGTDSGTPVPYENPSGNPVSLEIGLGGSDGVDAICAMDPTLRQTGGPNPFHFFVGTPRPGLMPRPPFLEPAPTLSASAFRNFVNGSTRLDTWMVGWPATGQGQGVAAVFLTFEDTLFPIFGLGPPFLRNHLNPVFAGDPQHFGLVVPPNLSLINVRVTFRWFALGMGAGQAAEAWPVRTEL